MTSVERLVVTRKLRKGTHERAAELIAAGPPFDPGDLGLARHAVYLGNDLAIFAFEGADVEERVRVVINDPVARCLSRPGCRSSPAAPRSPTRSTTGRRTTSRRRRGRGREGRPNASHLHEKRNRSGPTWVHVSGSTN
jgi:hypothetical protein